MSLRLHNNLTRRVEPFTPLDPSSPTLYVCGPTVYNYAHIGNARGPVVFDVLAALLRRRYGALRYARNITDVDDKIKLQRRRRASRSRRSPTASPRSTGRTWPRSVWCRRISNRKPPRIFRRSWR